MSILKKLGKKKGGTDKEEKKETKVPTKMVENINEEEMENQKNLEQLRLDIYGNISFDRNAEASEDNDLEINLQSSLEIEEFMNI